MILLIWVTAILGVLAFTNVVQGWFLVRTKWYEIILLLAAARLFLLPGRAATMIGLDQSLRYLMYLPGIAIYGGIYLLQTLRKGPKKPAIEAAA